MSYLCSLTFQIKKLFPNLVVRNFDRGTIRSLSGKFIQNILGWTSIKFFSIGSTLDVSIILADI